MKRLIQCLFMTVLFIFVLSTGSLLAQERVEIKTEDIELNIGESIELEAVYFNSDGVETDAAISWSVSPPKLGSFTGNVFTAEESGKGIIRARVGNKKDKVKVSVSGDDNKGKDKNNDTYPRIEINTDKVKLHPGEMVKLSATYYAPDSTVSEVTPAWSVDPPELATIDANGLLTAHAVGDGKIYAAFDNLEDTAKLAIDEEDDVDEEELPRIKMLNRPMKLRVGDTVQLEAFYQDSNGHILEVDLNWYVNPGYLGSIDEDLVFTAQYPGKGFIIARYDGTEARLRIQIEGDGAGWYDNENNNLPRVEIVTGDVKIAMEDSVQLLAMYYDTAGVAVDTSVNWSVNPAELGYFSTTTNGLFCAGDPGKGYIQASVGSLSDFVDLHIQDADDDECNAIEGHLQITPSDTTVEVGSVVQYTAVWMFQGIQSDTSGIMWSLNGTEIGNITEDGGLLTVTAPGIAFVKASLGGSEATASITAVEQLEAEPDSTGFTVEFSRVLPDGNVLPPQIIHEGDAYQMGALPSPLDILNDGIIYFPTGSLIEDITIHMLLPSTAQVGDSTVSFSDSSVAAIRFLVMVGDSIAEPYYFGVPLQLAIPYRPVLLDSLGLSPADLGIFFASGSGYNDLGISNITVDSSDNKIYATVEHFSTLVIRDKNSRATTLQDFIPNSQLPSGYILRQNYPNPFNPETHISYTLPQEGHIQIIIYNSLGQKVRRLVDEEKSSGSYEVIWDGCGENGLPVSSGLYIYRLNITGISSLSRVMILLR